MNKEFFRILQDGLYFRAKKLEMGSYLKQKFVVTATPDIILKKFTLFDCQCNWCKITNGGQLILPSLLEMALPVLPGHLSHVKV